MRRCGYELIVFKISRKAIRTFINDVSLAMLLRGRVIETDTRSFVFERGGSFHLTHTFTNGEPSTLAIWPLM